MCDLTDPAGLQDGDASMASMEIRRFDPSGAGRVWALNALPNIGFTADPSFPLALPGLDTPPASFPDLADIESSFIKVGGDFLVAERDGHLVGMGGLRSNDHGQAEVLRLRVHPATRREGVGRALMAALEERALGLGFAEMHLDTATNQPEAVAFYRGLGYEEVGQESRPEWTWALVYFVKRLR